MSELPAPASHNDAPDVDIMPVVEGLQALDAGQIAAELDREYAEKRAVDPRAGIIIAKLPEAGSTEVNGQTFRYYGARILPVNPNTPNFVNPHVHSVGQEPYLILDGTDGEMNTGNIVDGTVEWNPPRPVSPGEVIVIGENQVHSLRNTGATTFDFAFACPDSHLVDRTAETPDGDRMFTDQLNAPLPPHYPTPQQAS